MQDATDDPSVREADPPTDATPDRRKRKRAGVYSDDGGPAPPGPGVDEPPLRERGHKHIKREGSREEKVASRNRSRYLELIEHNEWEAETWHFYSRYDPDLVSDGDLDRLAAVVRRQLRGVWELGDRWLKPKDVDALVRMSEGGYMAQHSYRTDISAEDLRAFLDCESCQDGIGSNDGGRWYKGNYWISCWCDRKGDSGEDRTPARPSLPSMDPSSGPDPHGVDGKQE